MSYVEGSSGAHFKESGVAWKALSDQEQEDYCKRATSQNGTRATNPKRQWQDAMDDVLENVSLFSSSIVFTMEIIKLTFHIESPFSYPYCIPLGFNP